MKRGSPWSLRLLICCAAMVAIALLPQQGGQAACFVPTPGPAPAPPGSSATNTNDSSAAPRPAKPSAFPPPMYGGVTPGSLQPHECGGRCAGRCSATAYQKPCLFFCRKCCAACLCVPPGTYGNKNTCPCYNNWKTKRGGPKCP
uniref:GAST1 protein n=1 Tax=Zea mays TaxID=4577 RepID=B6TR96_MAIZE|nr:GAST1 protein precursor [Zea mays]ACG40227.1 GAST1 protein precursor [Zea mays]